MIAINKISLASPIDYAAEELRKYLRMMMPACGKIEVRYAPDAKDGFRLGLMQDFGLSVSEVLDTELDDLIYIDTDAYGGVIAGDNPRSVLLAVYEYLRQNGCRWLMPGVDGEYIPMQDIKPVKFSHAPSCRYRGWCNEGGEYQADMVEAIDFIPKVGMNVFMMEHFLPLYYNHFYLHAHNNENFKPETISHRQILQWKRECEVELEKRGIQFHDIGHGFTSNPFGLEYTGEPNCDYETKVKPEMRNFLTMLGGERKLFRRDHTYYANFCMSNPDARKLVVDYVLSFSKNNTADYLHVWLADGANNHCECEACQKKTPADWYMILMNEIDEALTKEGLSTRIVFIAYVDTIWAPLEEKIKNSERFTMLFAPIHRSYAYSMPEKSDFTPRPYERNKNIYPDDLAANLEYFKLWRKSWGGSCVAYEYHFWWPQAYDISGLQLAKTVNEDIKLYKERGINGIIEDGSQRCFFPHGLEFYSYARTLYDMSLTYEEIVEDYFRHAYGDIWQEVREYLSRLSDAMPYSYMAREEAEKRPERYYNPEMADKILKIKSITAEGRKLIEKHYISEVRVHTLSLKLLEYHADLCDMLADFMSEKALGNDERADELFQKARIEFGKHEPLLQEYYDHFNIFGAYKRCNMIKRTRHEEFQP